MIARLSTPLARLSAACLATALFVMAWLFGAAPARAEVRQIVLIQNSGWMEPYFADPGSEMKPLVTSLVAAAAPVGTRLQIGSFNQDGQLADRPSPHIVLDGIVGQLPADAVEQAVRAIDLPRRADGKLTDADFHGALQGTVVGILGGETGIIWLVTNNKNSPNNSQEVLSNTARFNRDLIDTAAFTRIVAYPIVKPARGPNYSANGLIVYGIAYGEEAGEALHRMTRPPGLRPPFADPAVTLKPLDRDPVRLDIYPPEDSDVDVEVADDGRVILEGMEGGENRIAFKGQLRNMYWPQVIQKATVTITWIQDGFAPVLLTPEPITVTDLPPQATFPVAFDLVVQQPGRAPPPGGWFEGASTTNGSLQVLLTDVELGLDAEFISKLDSIQSDSAGALGVGRLAGGVGNEVPDIFMAYRRVTTATTVMPITTVAQFSPWPILVLAGLAGVAVAAVLGGAMLMNREAPFKTKTPTGFIAGRVRPFKTIRLTDSAGVAYRVTGRLFGPPLIKPFKP